MSVWKDLFEFVKLAKLKGTVYCSQRKCEYFCTPGNEKLQMCFSQKNIFFIILLFIFILLLFYNILFLVTARWIASMNIFVQRVTSNVFFSNPYFLNWLTGYLMFWLTDWLEIWRSSPDVPLSHESRISKSDVFFFLFFLSPKRRKAQGKSMF